MAAKRKPYRGGGQRRTCSSHCVVWYETMEPGCMVTRCPHCHTVMKKVEMVPTYFDQDYIKRHAAASKKQHENNCTQKRVLR